MIQQGNLIKEADWVKRTTLNCLENKDSDMPRPVRVGEFLRIVSCKRLMKKAAPRLRNTFRSMRQWGVELPGGTEALIHWRGLIEQLCAEGVIEPLVAFDLDLANMFGTIEWPDIREAVREYFVEAIGWINF